ncbi:MAG: reverse gyrase, partial [Acidilobaceae archaeon]
MHMRDEGVEGSEGMVKVLRDIIDGLEDPGVLMLALRRGSIEGPLEHVVEAYRDVYGSVLDWIRGRLGSSKAYTVGSMVFTREDGGDYMYSPDVLTYVQASGRTSRLLEGRLTLGLSVIVEPMEHLVKAFALKLNWLAKASLANYDDLDIGRVKEELEKSRAGYGREFRVRSILVIVESPTKARTIAWFWGRPGKRRIKSLTVYETSAVDVESGTVYLLQVTASRGHVFDLVEGVQGSLYGVLRDGGAYSPVYGTIKRCSSCGAQFISGLSCPKCGSSNFRDSRVILEVVRKLAMEVDEVIVATDPDREGEKIAWDIFLALKAFNGNVKRAMFHEVTRDAFLKALREASEFNVKAVEAQIARRIVDRWVGYSLSEVLQNVYNARWMGAGRVQSPVLGWIVDRYSERLKSMGYSACLSLSVSYRICVHTGSREEAERLAGAKTVKVKSLELSEETLSPPPPFTTDSLIYEASRRFGLTAEATMRVAQELFESGLITYHRTDSTRVSPA